MRTLLIALVILFCVLFLEKNTERYVIPFAIAALFCFFLTFCLAVFLDVNIISLLLVRSDSLISNVFILSAYVALMITIVSMIKWIFLSRGKRGK
jgi:hypothetical protein